MSAPESFVLHYTPILATSEIPLATRRPESLYGREVLRIAHHLEGETEHQDQDATLRRIRDQLLRITAPAKRALEAVSVSLRSPRTTGLTPSCCKSWRPPSKHWKRPLFRFPWTGGPIH